MALNSLVVFSLAFAAANAFVVEPWLGVHERCNDPKFWCQSEATAKECGVVDYCNVEWGKSSQGIVEPRSADASPIKVTLYYESYCGGCRNFINSQWYPTYKKLNATGILQLELVPFGNAKEYKKGDQYVYYCQHGPQECVGNLIETCAIKHLEKISSWAPFIYCLETHEPTRAQAISCAKSLGIDYKSIDECTTGSEGNQLEHEMAMKTKALNPPHQYVPWIVVDGVHTDDIQDRVQTGMLDYVCEAYKGPKPAACSHESKKRADVCHKD